MKILIVEDEPKTGDYLRQGLREAGFAVDLVTNGVDGLHHALDGDHDLVILDVMLAVSNQGLPIAPEDIPRLFDRFYRADRSRAHPASEGAGLGLAITKAIVESHGGGIGVVSSGGRTVFRTEFPASLGIKFSRATHACSAD